MKYTTCTLAVLLVVSAYSASAAVTELPSPVIAWSGTNILNDQSNSVDDLLPSLFSTDQQDLPEAVLVFKPAKLSSVTASLLSNAYGQNPSGGALRNLKNAVDGAQSTLIQSGFVNTAESTPALVLDASAFSHQESLRSLKEHASLFNNGKPDLVVVHLPSDGSDSQAVASDDKLIGDMSKYVSGATDGKFVAMVSPRKASQQVYNLMEAPKQTNPARVFSTSTSTTSSTGFSFWDENEAIYLTPNIFTGLLIGLMLIIIWVPFVCCTMKIQTPTRFDNPSKKRQD